MQPTVPAWVSWYRRLRPGELSRPSTRARAPARLALYTGVFNTRDEHNLHLIRLDDMLGNKHLQLVTPPNEWLKRLNINADMWRAHISSEHAKSAIDYQQRFHNYPPVSIMVPPVSGGIGSNVNSAVTLGGQSPRGGHGGHTNGGAVWGGWAAGAVLLALLVLIVRAAEKCLDRRLFKTRRRQSDEWQTPNVMATSLQQQNVDIGSLPHLEDSEFSSPGQRNSDLPPPYSECAPSSSSSTNTNKNFNSHSSEEPPPPYSAVAFSNKDIPTVHIHRRQDELQTSSNTDNDQNNIIETQRVDTEHNYYDEGTMRVELVFDNGRIVERTIDIDNIDNVPDIVADVGETVIRNDDNITEIDVNENNRQDRVVLV